MDEKARHYLSRFKEFVESKTSRDRYTYIGIKPHNNIFYVITDSQETSAELRETLGFFFQGIEISILVISQTENRDSN